MVRGEELGKNASSEISTDEFFPDSRLLTCKNARAARTADLRLLLLAVDLEQLLELGFEYRLLRRVLRREVAALFLH